MMYVIQQNIPEIAPAVKSIGANLTDTEAKQVNSLYFTAIANGQNFIQNSQFIMFKNSAGFWEHRRKT